MSCFIYFNAEFHHADCLYGECDCAESPYVDWHYAECHGVSMLKCDVYQIICLIPSTTDCYTEYGKVVYLELS